MMTDHERGCQGREYTCTCGYDDERDALIETLVKALEDIIAPRQCGCSPVCQCNTADSLSIHLEVISDIASDALAAAKEITQ